MAKQTHWTTFVIKTVAATETPMTLGPDLQTIGQLRGEIYRQLRVPSRLQRLVGNGTSVGPHTEDARNIADLLPDEVDAGYDPIIWLLWMSDDDYYNVSDGGLILRSELAAKRAHYEASHAPPRRPFEVISLYAYAQVFARHEVALLGLKQDD